jgi:hypothetical protein
MKIRNQLEGGIGLLAIPLLMVGLPFFCIGGYEAWEVWMDSQNFSVAEGQVIGNQYIGTADLEDSTKETYAYYPEVSFRTETEQTRTFTSGIGTYPAKYEEGETVEVLYNPEDPSDARSGHGKCGLHRPCS